jgi:ring-1,2-phenylacetyl-CoA epoxidase subunit PaaD
VVAAGLGPARVTMRRAPAWSTDWIKPRGRQKLHDYGIAPPGPVDPGRRPAHALRGPQSLGQRLACPRCGSLQTERLSAFGSTACKSLYRCLSCREPFEHFKPI